MRKLFIVSIVFALPQKAVNGSQPAVDIQNAVGITPADSADDAYFKVLRKERIKYASHKVVTRVIIETSEIDLNISE